MPYLPPQRTTLRSHPEILVSPDEKGGIHGSRPDLRRSFVAPEAISWSHIIPITLWRIRSPGNLVQMK